MRRPVLALALAAGCQRPAAPPASTAPVEAPSEARTREALGACVPAPPLVTRPGGGPAGEPGPRPVAWTDLAPASSPDVDVLSVVVARGPYDLGRALGIPSIRGLVDAGSPGSEGMTRMYREFEGPRFTPLPDGRQVKLEARSLMLGGVVDWASLSGRSGVFTTVVVRQIPLHDAPLDDADRAAVERWDLATMAACLDRHFWP